MKQTNYLNKIKPKKNIFLVDKIQPRIFKNFRIEEVEEKDKNDERIDFDKGYYIERVRNDKMYGYGVFHDYNGDFVRGIWREIISQKEMAK